MNNNNTDQDLIDDDDSEGTGPYMGVFVGVLAQTALIASLFLVTSPWWVPVAIYKKVKSIIKPKKPEPRPTYRTVRPLIPIE